MSWLNNSMSHDNRTSFGQVQGRALSTTKRHPIRNSFLFAIGVVSCVLLIYSGSHYIGAFTYSQDTEGGFSDSLNQKLSASSIYSDLTNIGSETEYKRVYLRPSQSMRASYIMQSGSVLTISIVQCKSKPIFEVFSCDTASKRNVYIKDKTRGHTRFSVAEPGFYYFSETVTMGEDTPTQDKSMYTFQWKRA